MATSNSMRSDKESVLNLEADSNFQIPQHEANRDLRLDGQMNGLEIVPYTQPDKPRRRPNDCIMDPASIALDILVNNATGDDRSMAIGIYEDVFEIVCTKQKFAATPK